MAEDATTTTPINIAELAYTGNLHIHHVQIAGKDKVITDFSRNRTAIFYAVQNCTTEVVEAMLNMGVDVNQTDLNGETPLVQACWNAKWPTVELLVNRGADPSIKTNSKYTALHGAAECNAPIEILTLLIDAGAEIGAKARDGKLSVDRARDAGHDGVVLFLENYHSMRIKSANRVV
jgi:ankyrin repeat protein